MYASLYIKCNVNCVFYAQTLTSEVGLDMCTCRNVVCSSRNRVRDTMAAAKCKLRLGVEYKFFAADLLV